MHELDLDMRRRARSNRAGNSFACADHSAPFISPFDLNRFVGRVLHDFGPASDDGVDDGRR
jgi:hypothetical protein